MKVKQIILKILAIALITMLSMLVFPIQLVSVAKTQIDALTLNAKFNRYLNGEQKDGYALNMGGTNHPIFQLIDSEGNTEYYCLNATVGASWMERGQDMETKSVVYNSSYNLKTELSEIAEATDEAYKNIAKSKHLAEIIWILENVYIPTGNTNVDNEQKNKLLSSAGIVYSEIEQNDAGSIYENGDSTIEHAYKYIPQDGFLDYTSQKPSSGESSQNLAGSEISNGEKAKEGWFYYDETNKFTPVILPDELIEVAQQAAIWYYTNYADATDKAGNEQYNIRDKGLQLLGSHEPKDPSDGQYPNWKPLVSQYVEKTNVDQVDAKTGAWMQDQATIICWYLIDAAEKYATFDPETSATLGNPLKITKPVSDEEIKTIPARKINEKNCYIIGPIRIDEAREALYTLSDTIKVNDANCTEYYVLYNDTEITSSNTTVSDEVGKDIYLAIPSNWVKENNVTGENYENELEFTIEFNGTYKENKLILLESQTPGEQPIVKLDHKDEEFELTFKVEDPKVEDLALTKFITAISEDEKIDDGEYITKDGHIGSKTNPYLRATAVDTVELRDDPTCHDATYTRVKTPLTVPAESYVLYDIRVYNEGNFDLYAGEVKDHLPSYLEFVDCEFNDNYGWEVSEDGFTVTTKYLEYKEGQTTNLLKKFDKEKDDGKGSGLDYRDLQILCKVKTTAPENTKMINTAEISLYQDSNGQELEKDVDSQPDNRIEKNTEKREQDDDDWEVVIIRHNVDLALTKFITAVSQDVSIDDGEYITADKHIGSKTNPYLRATGVDTTELRDDPTCHDATYNTVKEPPLTVSSQSYVLYNIRIYNEGDVDLYAGEVTDHLPEYLNYVECDFNTKYRWKVSGEDGKTITTDYLSYEQGSEENLIKKFDRENDDGAGSGLDYRDLQVLCRVSDKAPANTKLVNVAEVTKYQDEIGDEIDKDVDSTPNNVDQQNEDDDDYEQVIVQNFDLSLLKWVSTVYVTEDGKTKTTQTGNTGDDSKDIIPKVEINRKKIDSTIVRFGYTIKVTNEGDVEGYVKEITDYVPEGLKFYSEDNNGWTDEGNNVISTRLLENTLLKPGESAEVTVILRWINGSDNLNAKTNVAEISEDYNDKGLPDKDSTPDNKKQEEDDIDDATVLLAISTGIVGDFLKITLITIAGLGLVALFGAEYAIIKKYVL